VSDPLLDALRQKSPASKVAAKGKAAAAIQTREKAVSLPPPVDPHSWRCAKCLMTFRVQRPRSGIERSACPVCGKPFWSACEADKVAKTGMWPHPYSEFLEEIQ